MVCFWCNICLAQPIFTNGNRLTQYGEFGVNAVITVYVYSVPKYSTSRWHKSNMQVPPSTKYVMSVRPAILNDTFHGKDVQFYVDHQRFNRIRLQCYVYVKAVIRCQSNCTINFALNILFDTLGFKIPIYK
jgi:hypothetical protein